MAQMSDVARKDSPDTGTPQQQLSWFPALPGHETWGLLAVLLFAAFLRFHRLGFEPLWIDEAASWQFAKMSLVELWRDIPGYEPHPPLYYSLLKFWSSAFGDTEAALRSLSALASLVTVYCVFLTGRLLVRDKGAQVALAAAALVAAMPAQLYFAQETRSYALLELGFALAFVAMAWWFRHPDALDLWHRDADGLRQRRKRQAVALFILGGALALWMHHTAVLLVGSLLALGMLIVALNARRKLTAFIGAMALGAGVLLLWVPCGLLLLQAMRELGDSGHIRSPNYRAVIYACDFLFGTGYVNAVSASVWRLASIAVVASFATAGAVALLRRGQLRLLGLLLAAAFLPVLTALVASVAATPMLVERALISAQLGYAILVACSLLLFSRVLPRLLVVGFLLAVFLSAQMFSPTHKEPWREIVGIMEKESGPKDLMFSWYDYPQIPMEYYRLSERIRAEKLAFWPGPAPYPNMREAILPSIRMSAAEAVARVVEAEKTHEKIWIVTRASIREPFMAEMTRHLTALRGAPVERVYYQTPGPDLSNPPTILLEYPARANAVAGSAP